MVRIEQASEGQKAASYNGYTPKDLCGPFPYFGGKRAVADEIWVRFGDPRQLIEPLGGSCALLLRRPTKPRAETINDINVFITNFFRACKQDPEGVAFHADSQKNQLELHARQAWLLTTGAGLLERCWEDPDFYDAKVAGWWAWGQCCWTGQGWCSEARVNQRPRWDTGNKGLLAQKRQPMASYLQALSERLRNVQILCSDWKVAVKPSLLFAYKTPVALLLDPPYGVRAGRHKALYTCDDYTVADEVRAWAVEHGDDARLRIALCGYADEHDEDIPPTWERLRWSATGGYGNQGNSNGKRNRHKEVVWFSPHCLVTGRESQAAANGVSVAA